MATMDVGETMVWVVRHTLRTSLRGIALAVTAVAALPLLVFSVFCVLLLPAGFGVVLAPKSLLALRRQAERQRRWASEWSGVTIAAPYRTRSTKPANRLLRVFRRCGWVLGDPATWRDLLWTLVNVPVSLVLGLLPAFMLVAFTWTVIDDYGTLVDGWSGVAPHGFLLQLLLLGMLPACAIAGPWLLKIRAIASSSLLAPTRKEMEARVGELTESRWDAVDASAAELRRIERDLHDGAQARLVALGMNIGFAEQMVRENPDLALTLLAEARESSGQALSELRALVRGIHPPALAERGLEGAVRALALSLPLPVEVHIDLPARPTAPVESAAYFAIAEALANVVKHSGASRAWAQLEYDDGRLVAIVGDNGGGGAQPRAGGGLQGIERRLKAFDGMVAVTSPVGGPTQVTMELPCELSLART
ncbi:MAG TPA: histidine kinase [Trebonia sp.]|jgi:signal transduction histidine kinase|nr:histidine kinase [Trebonia sp.]